MRLLDTETGLFVDFPDESKVPDYAILSHTWDPQGEQTYQELRTIRPTPSLPTAATSPPATKTSLPLFSDDPAVSAKVRMACVTARAYGHRYIWIDSCCIDKSSSAELSEAINSMYRWYGMATVCYAFLADVSLDENAYDTASQINRSRWFTRGWTLQELIAPRHVVFLEREWRVVGSKSSLAPLLEEVTGIERAVLTHSKELDAVSVADRMSWASRRTTTRLEDEAYSLLGIFDINMPTLYGEGRRAFARLQEEIVRQIPDQSLFAWGNVYLHSPSSSESLSPMYSATSIKYVFELDDNARSLFAPSPTYFSHSGSIRAVPLEVVNQRLRRDGDPMPIPSYTMSQYGMRTDLLLLDTEFFPFIGSIRLRPNTGHWYLAILACKHVERDNELLARVCYVGPFASQTQPLWGGRVYRRVPPSRQTRSQGGTSHSIPYSVISLSVRLVDIRLRQHTCYIPYLRLGHQEIQSQQSRQHRWAAQCTLPEWQKAVLRSQGYVVTTGGTTPTLSGADRYHITLSNSNHTITVEYLYRLVANPRELDAEIALSGPDLEDAHDGASSLWSPNTDELTVWLDAAVVPYTTSLHALEPNGVGQQASGPHEWVDFCTHRFEFPQVTLKTSELFQDDGETPREPPLMRLTRTIYLQVAIEPVADSKANPDSCSHHILIDLLKDEHWQTEELRDSLPRMDSGGMVKDKDKGKGSWVARLGKRFKSQTRLVE